MDQVNWVGIEWMKWFKFSDEKNKTKYYDWNDDENDQSEQN